MCLQVLNLGLTLTLMLLLKPQWYLISSGDTTCSFFHHFWLFFDGRCESELCTKTWVEMWESNESFTTVPRVRRTLGSGFQRKVRCNRANLSVAGGCKWSCKGLQKTCHTLSLPTSKPISYLCSATLDENSEDIFGISLVYCNFGDDGVFIA